MLTTTTQTYKLPLAETENGKVRANLDVSYVDRGYEEYFSVTGELYNYRCRNPYSMGQNVDMIAELYPENELVQEICELWEKHHLEIRTNIDSSDEKRISELIGISALDA